MPRRLSRMLLLLALLISIGGHWALLQTAAWTGMLITNAQVSSLSEAFSKTFDGAHPCKLCKAVERSQRNRQNRDVKTTALKKLVLFAERTRALWLLPTDSSPPAVSPPVRCITLSSEPHVPPPRAA